MLVNYYTILPSITPKEMINSYNINSSTIEGYIIVKSFDAILYYNKKKKRYVRHMCGETCKKNAKTYIIFFHTIVDL